MLRSKELVVECDGSAELRLRPGELAEGKVGAADPLADRGLDLRSALEVAPDEGGRAIEHLEHREPVAQRVDLGRGLGDHLAQEIVDGREIGALLPPPRATSRSRRRIRRRPTAGAAPPARPAAGGGGTTSRRGSPVRPAAR